jgi:alpha-D-xyloside xylohydrolase
MSGFHKKDHGVLWENGDVRLFVEAWGKDSLRIRSTMGTEILEGLPGALLEPNFREAEFEIETDRARIHNGAILAEIRSIASTDNHNPSCVGIHFLDAYSGAEILGEKFYPTTGAPARKFKPIGGEHFQVEVNFKAYPDERIYGLGQHQHNRLDQKGLVIDLVQRNGEFCIPFLLSSRGYGFLWNNPALGHVALKTDETSWSATSTQQIDYWITAGDSPAKLLENYADAVGHPPLPPKWASGFWQSKLRYRTQEELLFVANEYKRRKLPISVIIIDALHWTLHGDWRFDPEDWPDPEKMLRELEALGIQVMVSIWPTVNSLSENFKVMQERGWLVQTISGDRPVTRSIDCIPDGYVDLYLYDATHPEARAYIWDQIHRGYYRRGIKNWWLDVCEPETTLVDLEKLKFHLGSGTSVSNIYPLLHARAFYDGMKSQGEAEILNLSRSAWAGSQRYGIVVWSGDVKSSFDALQAQVRAGLNMGLSGIPFWTTDIGGFYEEDPDNFQELIVRWFQFGTFCPIFRLHGYRKPYSSPDTAAITGGPNEVWSFGDRAYHIIRELLFLREKMRPYIQKQMCIAHEKGIPPMRPLFFDFPGDPQSITVDDQFMFGPDILVAPILNEGALQRDVYLPQGTDWIDAWSGSMTAGGQWITAKAPLERIPLYLKKGVISPIRRNDQE